MLRCMCLAAAFAFAATACGKQDSSTTGATESPPSPPPELQPAPPSAAPAHIIRLDLPPEADDECTAAGPEEPLLNWNSSAYKQVEHGRTSQRFVERVKLADSDARIEVERGGCAHYGETYLVTFPKRAGTFTDELGYGISAAKQLVFADDAKPDLDMIIEKLRNAESAGQDLESDCTVSVDEMLSIHCAVSTTKDGETRVQLGTDVSL